MPVPAAPSVKTAPTNSAALDARRARHEKPTRNGEGPAARGPDSITATCRARARRCRAEAPVGGGRTRDRRRAEPAEAIDAYRAAKAMMEFDEG